MISNKINAIRSQIASAASDDAQNNQLLEHLDNRLPALHKAIKLHNGTTNQPLFSYVIHYINQVPAFIEAISGIAQHGNIEEKVSPLLCIATDYFLAPPELIRNPSSLESMLYEAYLTHRLLEEINDRFIGLCGIPLAPMDMTRANVITHELIGEPFANDLDQAVLFSTELLLNEHKFTGKNFDLFIAQHKQNNWSMEHSLWPCLADDMSIHLNFSQI